MVLPHRLVEWLLELDLIQLDHGDEKMNYWVHLAERLEWARVHVQEYGYEHEPCFLWGDDAQYNEQQDKLVTVSLGHLFDKREPAYSVWPLFCFRFETWTKTQLCNSCCAKCQVAICPVFLFFTGVLFKEQAVGFETLNAFLKPVPLDACLIRISAHEVEFLKKHLLSLS